MTINFIVKWGTTTLTDVQAIQTSRGRQNIQTAFSAGRAFVEGRDPSQIAGIAIGDEITILADFTPDIEIFKGSVSDVQIEYGIVANEDRWQISAEDAFALAGRATVSDTWTAGEQTKSAAQTLIEAGGLTFSNYDAAVNGSTVSAQTLTDVNLLATLNQLAQTEQANLRVIGQDTIQWIGRRASPTDSLITFTDGTATSIPGFEDVQFSRVQYRGLADNYADYIVVEPVGLAAQTSGTGDRSFTFASYDQNTTQANDLADYVLQTFGIAAQVPAIVEVMLDGQTADAQQACLNGSNPSGKSIAYLILRGATEALFISGVSLAATPAYSRMTFYLTDNEAYQFFQLDSDLFGILDTSKLGF